MKSAPRQLTGWHVLAIFVGGFAVIIGVNLVMAFKAIQTFPGLETKNSYVASQNFDRERTAQIALGWDVAARIDDGLLIVTVLRDGQAVDAEVVSAVLGRATEAAEDTFPVLAFDGQAYTAPVTLAPGKWYLRLRLRAEDGTLFQQRLGLRVAA